MTNGYSESLRDRGRHTELTLDTGSRTFARNSSTGSRRIRTSEGDQVGDTEVYAAISRELTEGNKEAGAYTRALAEAHGDADRIKILYVRYRFEALKRAMKELPSGIQTVPHQNDSQVRLAELTRQSGKTTLYTHLGLSPDAPQAELDLAIDTARARLVTSSDRPEGVAGLRYAVEILSQPNLKRAYDEKLLRDLQYVSRPSTSDPGTTVRAELLAGAQRRNYDGAHLSTCTWHQSEAATLIF